MSGGSRDYVYHRIRDDLAGKMYDAELDDLMCDIANLAHDVEWYDSGDICEETYRKSVANFKRKWFGTDRVDRLIGYVDTKIDEVKRDLYQMIIPEKYLQKYDFDKVRDESEDKQ